MGVMLIGVDTTVGLTLVHAVDSVARPPVSESITSPGGRYVIEIRLPETAGPHAAASTATLFRVAGSLRSPVWQQALPHRPRPRFALVADDGHVVLFDEWLNVRSERAVTVIGPTGQRIAQHDLEAVRAALAVPLAALAPLARHGPWMQAPPVWSAQGDACEVGAGGRTLVIRLRDGALSAR